IAWIFASASATACSGVFSPRAASANITGMIDSPKIWPVAGLAGPGCPTLVLQLMASLSTASLSDGCDPNGSSATQSPSLGTSESQAGKSYNWECQHAAS